MSPQKEFPDSNVTPRQVFFKPGVLADLQLEKEQKLNNFVIALQSVCRGAIARKRVDGLMVRLITQGLLFNLIFVMWSDLAVIYLLFDH